VIVSLSGCRNVGATMDSLVERVLVGKGQASVGMAVKGAHL
jgi:hypothetical protein